MNEPSKEHDMLARVVDALAEQSVPAGPSAAVNDRLKATLEQQSKRSAAVRPVITRRGPTMQKVMSIAAVLAVIAIGALVAMHPGRSGAVFAAMIDRMNEIRTVRFEMRTDVKDADEETHIHSTVTLARPWVRIETIIEGQTIVRISNVDDGKTLTLFEKTATLEGAKRRPALTDLVDRLRNLPKQGSEFLGKESVGGVEALKYRQEKKGDYYTVWIDPTTALPVQVNISDAQSSVGTTFSSFHWDVPVDSFQLTLEPPAGYTITSKTEN